MDIGRFENDTGIYVELAMCVCREHLDGRYYGCVMKYNGV